jgi:hypothetical protein
MEEEAALKQFYVATRHLREIMKEDFYLNDFDRICLENYISLLQMTYIEWKQRNVRYSDTAIQQALSSVKFAQDH